MMTKLLTDNPVILLIWVLVGVSVGVFTWHLFLMFNTSYVELQKKNQTPLQKETPMTYFISEEALRWMQIWLGGAILTAGAFVAFLMHSFAVIPFVLLAAVLAALTPLVYYNYKIRKRQEDFESRMLDFVMLLTNSMRAGLSLSSAIDVTSQAVGGSLKEEFQRALKEHRLGLDLQEALGRINQRIDCENLKLFIAAVSITTGTGGSITTILGNIATTIRMRNEFNDKLGIKIDKLKTNAKSNIVALFVLFLVCIVMLKDIFMPMLKLRLGQITLSLVVLLVVGACLLLKKISTVDI